MLLLMLSCGPVSIVALVVAPPKPALERLRTDRGPGFAVVENFLSPQQVAMLKEDIGALKQEGRFSVAGVGEASTNRVANDVRRCEQCFVFPRAIRRL